MRDRDRQTAEHFGILSKVESFEKELLGIDGIVSDTLGDGIDFDLSCWLSDMRYVIIVPRYSIDVRLDVDDYFKRRKTLVQTILDTASRFGLSRTEDRIEDYGEHFYIVLRCDVTWPNPHDFKEVTT